MAKQFFEVFPKLNLDKKVQDLFEQVTVEKVSATKSRDFIRVTIACDYLIPKETIFGVESEIKKQFFGMHNVAVKLYERFHLSEQYTPEKLLHAYKDSILTELKAYSPIEYNLLKSADITFTEDKALKLDIEDSVPARSRSAELSRILEKIFNERCGFHIACEVAYKEKKSGKYRQEDDLKIARQVAEITARAVNAESYGQGAGITADGESGSGLQDGAQGLQAKGQKENNPAKERGIKAGKGNTESFEGARKGWSAQRRLKAAKGITGAP